MPKTDALLLRPSLNRIARIVHRYYASIRLLATEAYQLWTQWVRAEGLLSLHCST